MTGILCYYDVFLSVDCGEQFNGFLDGEGIFDAEVSAAASLEGVEVGTGFQCFSEVAGEGADICAFAACHSDDCSRKTEAGIVRYIDTARCVSRFD